MATHTRTHALDPRTAELLERARQTARRRRSLKPDPDCPQCAGTGVWESGSGRVWISGGEVCEDLQSHGKAGRPCPLCWDGRRAHGPGASYL